MLFHAEKVAGYLWTKLAKTAAISIASSVSQTNMQTPRTALERPMSWLLGKVDPYQPARHEEWWWIMDDSLECIGSHLNSDPMPLLRIEL